MSATGYPGRWVLAMVLIAGSVLNYVDRTALAVVSKRITDELHLGDKAYGEITAAFLLAYTLSYGFGGMLVDRFGTRRSVALTITAWSLANMAHALARSQWDLQVCRFCLGLGEAMFFPAAMRGVAEWFVASERSKPIGLVLAGASLGAVIAVPLVAGMVGIPWIGWRGAFVVTGGLGLLVLPVWWILSRGAPVSEVQRSKATTRRTLATVASSPGAWILIGSRVLTDASWYLLLFWLPRYFQKVRGFTDADVAATNWIPYATADVGAVLGGWLAAALIARRGWPVLQARRFLMAGFAMLMPFSLLGFLAPADAPYFAMALFSVATLGHMAYGANHLSTHTDLFPSHQVATVMGLSGAAGSMGGFFAQQWIGAAVERSGSFQVVFLTTTGCHLTAALVLAVGLGWLSRVRSAGSESSSTS